jgi:hypothetical protein
VDKKGENRMGFGFVKAWNENQRLGVIETPLDGDINFLLRSGQPVPEIGACVKFQEATIAVDLIIQQTQQTETLRGQPAQEQWASETEKARQGEPRDLQGKSYHPFD